MTDYCISCVKGHEISVSLSELEELLENGCCQKCFSSFESVDPSEIEVECLLCFYRETADWESVQIYLNQGCPECTRHGFGTDIHIVGSFYHYVADFEIHANPIVAKKYQRKGRPDYSEIVTHFCNRDEMIDILRDGKIRANKTGYFRVPAVCLTEVPLVYAAEIREKHGDYGFAFRKRDIKKYGGQPAVYLTDQLLETQESEGGICRELKPFINVLRTRSITAVNKKPFDFLHEREWRVPRNIDLSKLKPLGLILPKGHASVKFCGPRWEEFMKSAFRYNYLS